MISPTRIAEITALAERLLAYRTITRGGQPSICREAATALTELLAEREAMVARMAVLEGALRTIEGRHRWCPKHCKAYDIARASLKEQS